jgi:hypothetical protein
MIFKIAIRDPVYICIMGELLSDLTVQIVEQFDTFHQTVSIPTAGHPHDDPAHKTSQAHSELHAP